MAIYSLHHQPIGKTTQARPYTAAAHVRYITRSSAASRVEAARMPNKPGTAVSYMQRGEDGDRKNARIADKLLLALPRELDAEQRAQLVKSFAEEVTQGRAPWFAAFHDKGKDAHNPHAHLMVRDRDPATGKRVGGLSEKGSTERLRELWETHANRALERAGLAERIDRRTLKAQGIERLPTIHEGPKAQQMDRRGARPESRVRFRRNALGARSTERQVDYRGIDGGRSRPEYNRAISQTETAAECWATLDAHKREEELDQLREIHHPSSSVDVEGSARLLFARKLLGLHDNIAGQSLISIDLFKAPLLPGASSGLDTGVVYEPGADNRQAHQERTDNLLRKENEPADNFRFHTSSVDNDRRDGKKKEMNDIDKILQMHANDVREKEFLHNNSKSLLGTTMERSFYDPNASMKKMDEYARKKNSREALYEKLDDKKQTFGRRPGSILSKEGYKPGAEAKRRDADIARQQLPHVLREADKNRANWADAYKAYQDARNHYYPKGGAGGGSTEGQVPEGGQTPKTEQGAENRPAGTPSQQPSAHREEKSGKPRTPEQAPNPQQTYKAAQPQVQRPQMDQDRQNGAAMLAARERLARERNPAYANPVTLNGDAQATKQPQASQTQGQRSQQVPQPDHDQQNNAAMLNARERLARERVPSPADNIRSPQGVRPAAQQELPHTPQVLPQRQGQSPQSGQPPREGGLNDDARRQMMDRMRDRQLKEKELEKQKGRGKGVGYGE